MENLYLHVFAIATCVISTELKIQIKISFRPSIIAASSALELGGTKKALLNNSLIKATTSVDIINDT